MDSNRDKIGLHTKFSYGIGSLGISLTSGIFGAWTQNFYIKMVGIDPLLWAWAWLVYMVWNAINDPIFGFISDNTRTRFGRRIPFLMVCAPLLSLSFVFMYFTPENSAQWIYFIWLLITLIAYDTCFTIVGLCFGALMSELSIDPEERASINIFQGIGGGIAYVITYLLPFLLIDNSLTPYNQNRPVFQIMILTLAFIGAVLLAYCAFTIKERPELMPLEKENLGLRESIKTTFKSKSFQTFVLFNFMMTYVQTSILANLSFYIQDVLNVSGQEIFDAMPMILFVGCMLLGFPIGIALNKKYGGKRAVFYLSIIVVIGFILVNIANDIIMADIAFAVLGLGFSGQILLSFTLLADIVDEDELKTGIRREGAYFGANALVTKPAQSLSAGIAGVIFALTLYNQHLLPGETQSELAIFGIKLLIGIIPAIFVVLGLIFLWFYPLDGSKPEFKEMKRQVAILHDQKLERLRKRLEGGESQDD